MDNVTKIRGGMQGFDRGGCDSCMVGENRYTGADGGYQVPVFLFGVPGTDTSLLCTWYQEGHFRYLVHREKRKKQKMEYEASLFVFKLLKFVPFVIGEGVNVGEKQFFCD